MRLGIALLVTIGIAGSALRAQPPTFEVATVKVNRTGSGDSRFPELRNGTLAAESVSLKSLLQAAYGFGRQRITGPSWLDSDRFDLTGKAPQGVPDSELMQMLQSLLKDRFQLKVHRETKEMPVFEMFVAKDGPKISTYDPEHPLEMPADIGGSVMKGTATMSQLAERISPVAGRPVLDKTGLKGRYAFILIFTPVSAQASDSGAPDFFVAVQQQLGLKLESMREPIEILVVDHAERVPSEN